VVGQLHGLGSVSSGCLGLTLLGDGLGVLKGREWNFKRHETKRRTWVSYHWRKGVASIWMMALLTKVFVRTSSLLEAL
jgi:hypothetical protein